MQNKSSSTESISLTFSIIAKIFLPKNKSERLGRLLIRLLRGGMSVQSLNQNITKLVEGNQIVYNSWLVVTERIQIMMVPLFHNIMQTVLLFETHSVPRSLLLSFISVIVGSTRSKVDKKAFLPIVLGFKIPKVYGISMRQLIESALNIYDIIHENEISVGLRSMDALDNEVETTAEVETELKVPAKAPRICVSYIKANFKPAKSPIAMITNIQSKSLASGSEGHIHEFVNDSVKFIYEMTFHMSIVFESLVRADQVFRSLLYCGSVDGIMFSNAINAIYGGYSKDIIHFPFNITSQIVKERCKSVICNSFSERYDTEIIVDMMTKQMPVFNFSPTILFSKIKNPFSFMFNTRSRVTANIMHKIGKKHSNGLLYLLDILMPLFVLTSKDEKICIIGTDAVGNTIYLFSRCAQCVDRLFSSYMPEKPNLNDIIKAAENEAYMQYSSIVSTPIEDFLSDFFEAFFSNDMKFYDLVKEAEERFGYSSLDLFTLVMYMTQLKAVCSRFSAQNKLDILAQMANIFSRASGITAQKALEARFPLYFAKMKSLIMVPLIKIEMSYGSNHATITPISMFSS